MIWNCALLLKCECVLTSFNMWFFIRSHQHQTSDISRTKGRQPSTRLPLFFFSFCHIHIPMFTDANLRCEGQRPEPGLLALSSCMAGTGLLKRWQKQNMAQTKTPEGARPSWKPKRKIKLHVHLIITAIWATGDFFFWINTYYFSMSLFIHMNWLWVHFRLHGYCNTVVNWGENTAFFKKEGFREDYARRSSLPRQSQTHNDLVITCPSTCQSIVVMSLNSNKQKLSFYWKSQIWLNSQMCLMQVADIAKVWWSTH